jgi:hypothetical protein
MMFLLLLLFLMSPGVRSGFELPSRGAVVLGHDRVDVVRYSASREKPTLWGSGLEYFFADQPDMCYSEVLGGLEGSCADPSYHRLAMVIGLRDMYCEYRTHIVKGGRPVNRMYSLDDEGLAAAMLEVKEEIRLNAKILGMLLCAPLQTEQAVARAAVARLTELTARSIDLFTEAVNVTMNGAVKAVTEAAGKVRLLVDAVTASSSNLTVRVESLRGEMAGYLDDYGAKLGKMNAEMVRSTGDISRNVTDLHVEVRRIMSQVNATAFRVEDMHRSRAWLHSVMRFVDRVVDVCTYFTGVPRECVFAIVVGAVYKCVVSFAKLLWVGCGRVLFRVLHPKN